MKIKFQPMGMTQTNCYIVSQAINGAIKEIIIDPGMDATSWVLQNTTNPIAILNTHGHYDHVWSNAQLQNALHIPLYIPKGDAFMLQNDPLHRGTPTSKPDFLIDEGDQIVDIDGFVVKFRHFPGHTPGCSVIEVDDVWFSGDFLFDQSIGRWDFPFSNAKDMLNSLQKASKIEENYTLYPGHGLSTTLKREQKIMHFWEEQVRRTL